MVASTRHHLVIYTKARCPLCDKALLAIRRLQDRYVLSLEEIDITEDPTLFEQYRYEIPVIVVDGIETLKAPIEERELQRALDSLEEQKESHRDAP